ncbi:uncharacterized protein N7477_005051 [Penicillium maclennaniae]|uniref:uncharacterized protein n=1 Tax=Penicillium maclennaniae TaxID=1343394 RepID=UPI00254134C1|nr:uncharacterized protein N7477_005051 [Penicillium maclennaniae]KAJ5675117.1 hypothetical protein N7477_005051 [Penicillium maclennaniae]
MTAYAGQFLAGKRIIVTGGSFAVLSFVIALGQLWNSSLERPEVTVRAGRPRDDGLVAIQQLGLLDEVRKHAILNGGDIRVWADNWKWLSSINPTAYGNLPAATMRITREDLKRILVEKAETANTEFTSGNGRATVAAVKTDVVEWQNPVSGEIVEQITERESERPTRLGRHQPIKRQASVV